MLRSALAGAARRCLPATVIATLGLLPTSALAAGDDVTPFTVPLKCSGLRGRFTRNRVVYGMLVQPEVAAAGHGETTRMPVGVYSYSLPVPEMKNSSTT